MHLSPIIEADELLRLHAQERIVLVDARTGPGAKERFTTSHLIGAMYVDMDRDLSQPITDASQGGRHPLPTLETFSQVLGRLRIEPNSHVVVYDDKSGSSAAARFWWMLCAVGHQKIQVLNGGLAAALAAGFPTSSHPINPIPGPNYPVNAWHLPIATADEVAQASQDNTSLVIDVREPIRYRGEHEPIDLVAGHIPGAVNVPFNTNLNDQGLYLSPEALRAKYESVIDQRDPANMIVHCGSGVTACHTLLAMAYAGLAIPKLYVGSWSEWSRSDRPIAKAEQ